MYTDQETDGLISADYDPESHIALFIYVPEAGYDIEEVVVKARYMSDGKVARVMVYEGGEKRAHDMVRSGARWHDIAH
jgi:hypothetical protein